MERVAIKLEGQVEVILFPAVHPRSTQTGEEYQFVLGALDYFGDDDHHSVSLLSSLGVSSGPALTGQNSSLGGHTENPREIPLIELN